MSFRATVSLGTRLFCAPRVNARLSSPFEQALLFLEGGGGAGEACPSFGSEGEGIKRVRYLNAPRVWSGEMLVVPLTTSGRK